MEVKVTIQGVSHTEAKEIADSLRSSLLPYTIALISEGETYSVERDKSGLPYYDPDDGSSTGVLNDPWSSVVHQYAPEIAVVLPLLGAAASSLAKIVIKEVIEFYAERDKGKANKQPLPKLKLYGPDGSVVSEFSSDTPNSEGPETSPLPSDAPS
jgi:hypothetical protein